MINNWIDDCVVLSYKDYGDRARLVNILTRQYGKVTGVLNNFTRLNLSVCDIAEVEYRSKKSGSIGYLSLKSSRPTWIHIISRKRHLLVCQAVCSDLNNSLHHNIRYPDIFDMTIDVINDMSSHSDQEVVCLYLYFCIRLLRLLGYGFDDKCSSCGSVAEFIEYGGKSVCSLCKRGEMYFSIPRSWKYWNDGDTKYFVSDDLKNTFEIVDHFFENHFGPSKNSFRSMLINAVM